MRIIDHAEVVTRHLFLMRDDMRANDVGRITWMADMMLDRHRRVAIVLAYIRMEREHNIMLSKLCG